MFSGHLMKWPPTAATWVTPTAVSSGPAGPTAGPRPPPPRPVAGGGQPRPTYSLIARAVSRLASRSAIECRLSYCLLPRARAISTLARPSLK
jgi:hypothetical protein